MSPTNNQVQQEALDSRTLPISPADTSLQSLGGFRLNAVSASRNRPIQNARVSISYSDNPVDTIEELVTDENGQTATIELPAPPLEYSQEPLSNRPYSVYTLRISADGYEPIVISGAEILPTVTAISNVELIPLPDSDESSAELFVIGPHTLYGEYPPHIVEEEIKPLAETGEIVLNEVVIPEYIVVHDGVPNSNAKDYYVRYRDYIKNVASSEIYATWPSAAIYANILAIQSFTLNRVYTEWYRGRGYNFTITSSTAYDHKWIPERNIYDTISAAVDDVFNNYLSRPNVKQPILTQYCDGKRVTCPDLMSQWGSKDLADRGFTAAEILRYYYGSSIYINSTYEVSGVPVSWPGYELSQGSSGNDILTIQRQLNAIADVYSVIPNIAEDAIYGPRTAAAVEAFQRLFDLSPTGTINFSTWYKISSIYVAVTRIAEYM